jgi:hypothetical protein
MRAVCLRTNEPFTAIRSTPLVLKVGATFSLLTVEEQ